VWILQQDKSCNRSIQVASGSYESSQFYHHHQNDRSLSPVHTSNIVEATVNFIEAPSTPATMSKQHCRMLQVERFFRQCRMLLRHCCRFRQRCCRFRRQCRTKFRPFDNVETNCSICFDFVEMTKFYNRIVRQCCRLLQQSRMLLRQSRTLPRQPWLPFFDGEIKLYIMLPVASTLLLVWTGPNVI